MHGRHSSGGNHRSAGFRLRIWSGVHRKSKLGYNQIVSGPLAARPMGAITEARDSGGPVFHSDVMVDGPQPPTRPLPDDDDTAGEPNAL